MHPVCRGSGVDTPSFTPENSANSLQEVKVLRERVDGVCAGERGFMASDERSSALATYNRGLQVQVLHGALVIMVVTRRSTLTQGIVRVQCRRSCRPVPCQNCVHCRDLGL